jgi:hypothetical protein
VDEFVQNERREDEGDVSGTELAEQILAYLRVLGKRRQVRVDEDVGVDRAPQGVGSLSKVSS